MRSTQELPAHLLLVNIRVLRRRLARALENLRIRLRARRAHVGDREQDAPLVAEVEDIRDLLADREPERPDRDLRALASALLELERRLVALPLVAPELAVEPERVEVVVLPAEARAEEGEQQGERLRAGEGDRAADAPVPDEVGAEDVCLALAHSRIAVGAGAVKWGATL